MTSACRSAGRSLGQEEGRHGKASLAAPQGLAIRRRMCSRNLRQTSSCVSAELRGMIPCALTLTAWAQASLGLVNVEAKPPETTAPPPPQLPLHHLDTAGPWLNNSDRGNNEVDTAHASIARPCLPRPEEDDSLLCATPRLQPMITEKCPKGALGTDLPYHLHQYRSWWPSCLKCPGPIPPVTASERGRRCITSHTGKGILPIRRKHPVPHLHLQATYLTLQSISTRPPPASCWARPNSNFLACLVATDRLTVLQQPSTRLRAQGGWPWKRVSLA